MVCYVLFLELFSWYGKLYFIFGAVLMVWYVFVLELF